MSAPDGSDPVADGQGRVGVGRDVLDRKIILNEGVDECGERKTDERELRDHRRTGHFDPGLPPERRTRKPEECLSDGRRQREHQHEMTELWDHVRGPLRMSGFTGMTPAFLSLMARATSGGM